MNVLNLKIITYGGKDEILVPQHIVALKHFIKLLEENKIAAPRGTTEVQILTKGERLIRVQWDVERER